MFSSRMNFADQADWCDSGVLAAKQRLASSGRLPWVAGQDICPTGYSQGGIASRGEFGPLGYGRQSVGGFNIQNLPQQQRQQQLFDDLEYSNFGQSHPFLANHPLLNAAANRFQTTTPWMNVLQNSDVYSQNHPLLANHPLLNAAANRFQRGDHPLLDRAFPLAGAAVNRVQSVKANIVDELVQDRQRDEIQAHLIKQLIRKSSTTRNRMGLIQALVSGQYVPRPVIAQLLAEDFIMDYACDNMVKKIVNDSVNNRHADHIIFDLASGRPHLPHPEQKAIADRENFIKDQFAIQGVQRVTAPYANKKIITDEYITSVLETLAQAQQVGYGSHVTPQGIQYAPAQTQQAWI
ncbi:hypothetical protein HDU98_009620 [Podochytrium sp. JEL0797]|nr:hypothetical protein HDU98_009620 [Podochytrium sp. JEL0797]